MFLKCKKKHLKMIYTPEIEVWHKEGRATEVAFGKDAELRRAKMAYEAEEIVIKSL